MSRVGGQGGHKKRAHPAALCFLTLGSTELCRLSDALDGFFFSKGDKHFKYAGAHRCTGDRHPQWLGNFSKPEPCLFHNLFKYLFLGSLAEVVSKTVKGT